VIGKITAALIKKEAEAYRSQGLHQEAIDLYARLLDAWPNLDPGIEADIRAQLKGLSNEKEAFTDRRGQPLDAVEIRCIRQGWGDSASEKDILICAEAFFQIGAFREALVEFAQVLSDATHKSRVSHAVAECLVRCHNPRDLPAAVLSLCREHFTQNKASLAFQLQMIKPLARYPEHALHYYRYLLTLDGLPSGSAGRLTAAVERLSSTERHDDQNASSESIASRLGAPVPPRGWQKWIASLVRKNKPLKPDAAGKGTG
jgi:tetratricopeptide (TPR) repeat protein